MRNQDPNSYGYPTVVLNEPPSFNGTLTDGHGLRFITLRDKSADVTVCARFTRKTPPVFAYYIGNGAMIETEELPVHAAAKARVMSMIKAITTPTGRS